MQKSVATQNHEKGFLPENYPSVSLGFILIDNNCGQESVTAGPHTFNPEHAKYPNAGKYMSPQASLKSKAHFIQNYTAVPKKEYPERNELFLFLYS